VLVDGVVLVPVVPLLELGAAAAPAMPATAPALASAPAIIVARSIFETFIASNLLSSGERQSSLRALTSSQAAAKSRNRPA
jgi:hypothetical protein